MSLLSCPQYEGLIDRDVEVNELVRSIKEGNGEVNILFSPTGIGKSSLVKKLIYKLAEKGIPNVILIKTLPLNSCIASSEWLYIDFIFDAFHKFYENAGDLSFQYFLTSGNNKLINKQIHERSFEHFLSIDSFKQLLFASVFNLGLQSQELFEFNPYKISADNSMFSRVNKSQYIKYVLDNVRVIFIILKELNAASIILIEPDNQTICVAHSSLIDEWESNLSVFSGIDRIVFNRLEMICNHILQNTNTQTSNKITYYEAWQYLLQIYAKREPAKISHLLEELESGIIYNVSAANIGYYIFRLYHR